MATERELKFLIDPDALPGDEAVAGAFRARGIDVERVSDRRHTDRYYDDPRLSLARAGVALRRRIGGGRIVAALKTRGLVRGALHERDELESPMEGREWPNPILDRLVGLADPAALKGRWELETVRRRYVVRRGDRVLAEITFDVVEASRPTGGRTVRFAELEVEDRGGGEEALYEVAEALQAVLPLTPSAESKLERARRMLMGADEG